MLAPHHLVAQSGPLQCASQTVRMHAIRFSSQVRCEQNGLRAALLLLTSAQVSAATFPIAAEQHRAATARLPHVVASVERRTSVVARQTALVEPVAQMAVVAHVARVLGAWRAPMLRVSATKQILADPVQEAW